VSGSDSAPKEPDAFEAEQLRTRLSTGELSQERVALAAALGHRGAALVSGHDCQESMSPCVRCWSGFQPVERACDLGGPEAALRIAIAGARCCFLALQRVAESEEWEQVSAAVRREWAGDALLQCTGPWPEAWRELSSSIEESIRVAEDHLAGTPAPADPPAWSRLSSLGEGGRFNLSWALLPAALIQEPEVPPTWSCLDLVEPGELFGSIAAEVVPWALSAD
jgi:hypothetical protein